jgi:hypothetical protein
VRPAPLSIPHAGLYSVCAYVPGRPAPVAPAHWPRLLPPWLPATGATACYSHPRPSTTAGRTTTSCWRQVRHRVVERVAARRCCGALQLRATAQCAVLLRGAAVVRCGGMQRAHGRVMQPTAQVIWRAFRTAVQGRNALCPLASRTRAPTLSRLPALQLVESTLVQGAVPYCDSALLCSILLRLMLCLPSRAGVTLAAILSPPSHLQWLMPSATR